jgi:hypothetical protein
MNDEQDNAMAFRKMSSDFFTKVRHETQTTSREDIDSVMLAVRHMETRILDRVEELASQIDEVSKRLDATEQGAGPTPRPKRPPKGRRAGTPRKRQGRNQS